MKILAPIFALTICYALFATYLIFSYESLPDRVASHFDLNGQPNGWMSRQTCVGFTVGIGVFLPALIVGKMAFAGCIPVSWVNLPHRDYWLAPERRKSTLSVLLIYGLWYACLTVLFATGLHWLIVQANTTGGHSHLDYPGFFLVVGGFLFGTIVWLGLLRCHFHRPRGEP
jgi:amino acid transporter